MGAGPKVRCTLCGDVIQSMHRHDMRWCGCGAGAIDGGDAYTRLVWKTIDGIEYLPEVLDADDE